MGRRVSFEEVYRAMAKEKPQPKEAVILDILAAARRPLRMGEVQDRAKFPRSTTWFVVMRAVERGTVKAFGRPTQYTLSSPAGAQKFEP